MKYYPQSGPIPKGAIYGEERIARRFGRGRSGKDGRELEGGQVVIRVSPSVVLHHHHRRVPHAPVTAAINARWDNLTAHWKMDETSDGSAPVARADTLGNYDLTDNNTVPSTTGIINNAANFTGTNNESLSNTSSDLQWGGGAFTLLAWVNPANAAATPQVVVSKDNNAGAGIEYRLDYILSGVSRYRFRGCGSATTVLTGEVDAGTHMIVVGYDGAGNIFIGVDGAARTTQAITASGTGGAATFFVGHWAAADWDLTGWVDEVAYFKGDAKDATWDAGMYNSGAGRAYPD